MLSQSNNENYKKMKLMVQKETNIKTMKIISVMHHMNCKKEKKIPA
jgi:hypothetical protein